MIDPIQNRYNEAKVAREKETNRILESTAPKKIVVAGPGTGKTYLFQQLLKRNPGNSLTLTFINALVDELSLSLSGLSEVRTLHGYALSVLASKGFRIFPKLPKVIANDARVLREQDVQFEALFQDDPIDPEKREFYEKRRGLYGQFYGYADIIHALVQYYKQNENEIPTFKQILVDEFQDFNKFEVELIELLAAKSPILITGDDDQSLYMHLKKATAAHIRRKHGQGEPDYIPFPLSYCSRSTEVVVEAINDFISSAVQRGFLKDRIEKPYKYFPAEKMDEEGKKHQKIIFRPVFAHFLTDYFQREICNIAERERGPFDILIIVPNGMKKVRFPQIRNSLDIAGFRNVRCAERQDTSVSIADGLSLIRENPECNLGWRIVLSVIATSDEFRHILKLSAAEPTAKICALVGEDCASKVRTLASSFQKLLGGEELENSELDKLLSLAGYDRRQMAKEKMREDCYSHERAPVSMRSIRDIRIHLTTVVGSKGLSADYVFLLDFSDGHFSKSKKISDQNIYDFLVAMTRARKQLYLISPDDKEAYFLGWIKPERVDRQRPFLIRRAKGRAAGGL